MKQRWIHLGVFLIVGWMAAGSSLTYAKERLTLKACVRNALNYNYSLRSFASKRRSVAMEVNQALSSFFPTLSLGTSFERSDWEGLPRSDHSDVNLKASYNLFRGGRDWSNLKSKRHAYHASDYDFQEEGLNVIASVEDTFFAILSLRNRLEVLKKSVEAAALHESYARGRVKAELAPLSDELRAQVDLSNAQVDLVQARRNLKTLKHTLAILMGRSPFKTFRLVKETLTLKAGNMTLSELFSLAKKKRPILKSLYEQILELKWQEKSLKSEFMPTLDSYITSGEEGYGTFPDRDYWTVGIELRYPFFTGFSTHYAVASTRARLEAKRWDYSQKILQVQKEIADAYDQFKTDQRVIKAREVLLKSALENLKVAQHRYKVGVGSIVELTDARVDATRAAIGLENAKLTVLGDEIELRRATGWFVPMIKALKDGKNVAEKRP